MKELINHKNEYQWRPITSESNDEHNDFLPRFICLPASYSSLWRFTHLEVHALIGFTRQTLKKGAAQPTQDEDHTSHEQSTRVHFGSPPGKGQEPLTITTIRAKGKHLPPLDDPRRSKPSRWWQPQRVTSESRIETPTPSASRCNHSSSALGFTLNLTKMMNLWWRWVGGL